MKTNLVVPLIVIAMLIGLIGHVGAGTEDFNNTFYGHDAGYSVTTGQGNTFNGAGAGYSNTNGRWNTFSGYQAGYSDTTADGNTFTGANAGYSTTVGTSNTFSGYQTGYSNTTGSHNAFIGFFAGYYNTTGSGNTFSGVNVGQTNTTGNDDTYIGYQAGAANTSGSGNVFLGFRAGFSEAGSNKLYIDNCYGRRPCITPLIYGQFDQGMLTINGNLGIGVMNPTTPIQLSGGAYSDGSEWLTGSSRKYKENIHALSQAKALRTFKALNPVTFTYKTDPGDLHVGFIAEEVPDILATKDRKGLSALDIVAVLTKVAQVQSQIMHEQKKTLDKQQRALDTLTVAMTELKAEVKRLKIKTKLAQ